jgi:hypothetical protein
VSAPSGMTTRWFVCTACGAVAQFTVHADRPGDPGVMDRYRLLAAANQWCIDFDGVPWCPAHRDRAVQR